MTAALLDAANASLRDAVAARMAATDPSDPKMVGYSHSTAAEDERDLSAAEIIKRFSGGTHSVDVERLIEQMHEERGGERLTGDGVLNAGGENYSEWKPPKYAEQTTAKFGTGAVRSASVESFRYDLVSPIGLREVARTCAEGAVKYSDFNWEKGMPVHDLLNHAIAHVYAFLSGDRSEPHLGHAAWNLLAAIHSHELWPHLNEGHLRTDGCRCPEAAP